LRLYIACHSWEAVTIAAGPGRVNGIYFPYLKGGFRCESAILLNKGFHGADTWGGV